MCRISRIGLVHLPLLTEYHLIEVGGQFFADTLFAFADSSGSGVADVGNDIVAIA